jgi:hypothetical protein
MITAQLVEDMQIHDTHLPASQNAVHHKHHQPDPQHVRTRKDPRLGCYVWLPTGERHLKTILR